MARRKARGGVPWLALIVVSACSLAAGWELAKMQHPQPAPHRIARVRGHDMVHPPLHPRANPGTPAALSPGRPAGAGTGVPAVTTQAPEERATPLRSPRALPASARPGGARLAIIIDDCGQWLATEKALVALPIPLTVSIMPDAPYTSAIERDAADSGQGVMLHLPMEPRAALGHTQGEITTAMDDADIERHVRDDLARVPLARGVNNHEGSKATADSRVMHDVALVLAEEGRYFVDSRTTAATVGAAETQAQNVPTLSRNVFLDDEPTVASIEAQLLHAAEIARSKGTAIAIGHPKAAVLAALRAEIPRIQDEGVTFTLVQDLLQ